MAERPLTEGSWSSRRAAAVWGPLALTLLPLVGLVVAWYRPAGLFAPPPLDAGRVVALVVKTVALAVVVSIGSVLLGTLGGWMSVMARYRGRRWLTIACLLPLAMPSYVLATVTREALAPGGWLGSALGLKQAVTGFVPAAVVLTLCCAPYVHIMVSASLSRIPGAEMEAARSLGAAPRALFSAVILPRLRPAWTLGALVVLLYVVADFGAVAILDCEVLTWELYKTTGSRDAVVLSFAIVSCVVPLVGLVRLFRGSSLGESDSRGDVYGGEPPSRPLLWCAGVMGLLSAGWGVAVPIGHLLTWVWGGLQAGISFAPVSASTGWTLVYALLGASLTVALAFGPAHVGASRPVKDSDVVTHVVHLTSSLPGVVVGVGLLHLTVGFKRLVPAEWAGFLAAAETLGLVLAVGYAVRFLSLGYDALASVMAARNPRLAEAARSLGAGARRTLLDVELPQIWPGVRAAWVLVFIAIAKELPLTVLLAPLGQHSLAYRLFDAQQEGSMPDVGLAGLLLVTLALVAFLAAGYGKQGAKHHG